ncbi:MAG: LTA synthase family protein [Oscillospiraceae bacterium]|nr:LTA synthase family protein [Oscillospiraceae bacterium]
MKIATSKKNLIIGSIISVVLLAFLIINCGAFFNQGADYSALLFVLCIMVSLITGAILAFNINFPEKVTRIVHTVCFLLVPIVSMQMVECLNRIFIYDFSYFAFFANYILYFMLYGLVYIFSGSYKLPIFILNPIFLAFGLTNYWVTLFRGSPFVPMDILSAGTAKTVVSTYNFSVTYQIAIAVVLFVFLIAVGVRLKSVVFKLTYKLILRGFCSVLIISICIIYFFTDIFANNGLKPDFWMQTRGYHNNGALLSFCLNTKYLYVISPKGYNADEIEGIVSSTVNDEEAVQTFADISDYPKTAEAETVTPNVICIMNESFADLSVLGDFETNEDYMPFYNSLTENAIKGNLYVPVIGSGTSNTEFEFLTGNSVSFLPAGSNTYKLYVKKETSSLVSTLGSLGYAKFALHPYFASGWNRNTVYPLLGFEKFYSLGSLMDPALMTAYYKNGSDPEYLQQLVNETYPNSNMLLRQYICDEYNYKKVIQRYSSRDTAAPFFMFNVTMQNHGGYGTACSNLNQQIFITSTDTEYPKANLFLSLIKESDSAFEYIIDYFSNIDEPTIICMFGDHQPAIETDFIEELLGSELDSLTIEQEQRRYVTPFVIWANYDIKEQYIDKLSANYLSSLLLQTAGIEMTDYNKFLLKLSETLPVIDSVGYIDANDNYYTYNDNSIYSKLLSNYNKVQNNNMFDAENRRNNLFYLTEQ